MRKWLQSLLAILPMLALTNVRAADGALDTTFGGGTGIVLVRSRGAITARGTSPAWQCNPPARSSSGWINKNTQLVCFVLRLNRDGSVDPTFTNHNSLAPGYSGYGDCRFHSIAVRPNDAVVAAGEDLETSTVRGSITPIHGRR